MITSIAAALAVFLQVTIVPVGGTEADHYVMTYQTPFTSKVACEDEGPELVAGVMNVMATRGYMLVSWACNTREGNDA